MVRLSSTSSLKLLNVVFFDDMAATDPSNQRMQVGVLQAISRTTVQATVNLKLLI